VIKLTELLKDDCHCGESCCSTKESVNESVDDLKNIVKELEGASKLHAGQSVALAKASKMHAGQAKRIQAHLKDVDESIVEGADDVRLTKRQFALLIRQEMEFRKRMQNIEQGFLRDPNEGNKKLSKAIQKSYKDNVTKFMRDVVSYMKKMK
jgi:hypothetical protein